MGILIDFQEAKDRLLNPKSANTTSTPQELQEAVEKFAYSQIPKTTRIAMTLAGLFSAGAEPVFSNIPENYADMANELMLYIDSDFMLPYKAKDE